MQTIAIFKKTSYELISTRMANYLNSKKNFNSESAYSNRTNVVAADEQIDKNRRTKWYNFIL